MQLDDLLVYKTANEIGRETWKIVSEWKNPVRYELGSQLIRAADSIALNIAEGYGRYHFKENKNFCYFSRGTAYETLTCIKKADERALITKQEFLLISEKINLFLKLLNGYIRSIGNAPNS